MRVDPKNVALTADPASRPASALDFKQFAAMRRGADGNDPAALREVARQFESIFTKMMLEGMRSASFGDPQFGSDQSDMYQGMMDDQMAVQLSSGRGIGLADMLIRQLSHGGQGTAAPDGEARPLAVTDQQRRSFIDQVLPHAEAAARELGVDVRSVIAQAALETGWGTSQPADATGNSHNLFGIKAGSGWNGGRVASDTTEFRDGVARTERAQFRAYGSVAENLDDYVRLLRDNPRYAAALNTGSDVRAFATALQRGGYATDPAYADKIVSVAEQVNNVTRFKSAASSPISTREPSSDELPRTGING